MNNKTFKFVNTLYVIMITNILAIVYLALGLFSFTLVPVIFTVIEVMKELIDEEIDGYSGIIKYFTSKFLVNLMKHKREEVLTGIYTLMLLIAIFLLKRISIPYATSVNMLFMYIYTIISVYWSYYALRTLYEEKNFNYMNIVIIMFKNIKSLLKTIFIFIALILLGIAMKEILVLFSISLFGFLFVKLNHKAITN